MKRIVLAVLVAAGCNSGLRPAASLTWIGGVHSAPRIVTGRAAVLFWLSSADTLSADSAAAAMVQLQETASDLGEVLARYDVALLATSSSRLIIGGPGRSRRPVSLDGLDYPWGVVLVDPGFPEQIITGPVDADALEELVWTYFDLENTPATRRDLRVAVLPQAAFAGYRLRDRQIR